MPLRMQVVGMPMSAHRRLRNDLQEWAEGQAPNVFRFEPSFNDQNPVLGPGELARVEANIQEGFAHILVFDGRHTRVAVDRYRWNCRVVRMRLGAVEPRRLSAEEALAAIGVAVIYELKWHTAIAPKDVQHPLLLPPASFTPVSEVSDYWAQCDCYANTALIDVANTLLQRVRANHRRTMRGAGASWVDDKGLRFRVDPSRHGLPPEARSGRRLYRFSWEVPADLHFDVVHEQGRPFRIRDRLARYHSVDRANVNPWGDVRSASL